MAFLTRLREYFNTVKIYGGCSSVVEHSVVVRVVVGSTPISRPIFPFLYSRPCYAPVPALMMTSTITS